MKKILKHFIILGITFKSASMPQTPGVYIKEINPFPSAVTQVDVAIPIFIGYTQKAGRRGKSLVRLPIKVTSLNQYISAFGQGFNTRFRIVKASPGDSNAFLLNKKQVTLQYCEHNTLYLYQAVQLFFLNGGAECYILSVGIYGEQTSFPIMLKDFTGSQKRTSIFNILDRELHPTLVVLPDVIADTTEAYPIYQSLLNYCATSKRHFAILDVGQASGQQIISDLQEFREAIGTTSLQHGAAYYPWLNCLLVDASEVNFTNLDSSVSLEEVLHNAAPGVQELLKQIGPGISRTKKKNIQLALLAASPEYARLMEAVQFKRNIMPPSGAVAGIYNFTDHTLGVWKAAANATLRGVTSVAINLTDSQQQSLLSDVTGGKYINAIRQFTGKGTLIWGARTLAGNSDDWRYITVRRSIIMLEQSLGEAMKQLLFEPNTLATWTQLKVASDNFLFTLWKQGALAGTKQQDAYHIKIGAGSTMTDNDVLEGRLRMQVMVALLKPAEFLVLTFEQMQNG